MANTLRFKRGLVATIPTAVAGEPLFTTDTFDLYIGNGTTNTRFQKYIASGTTSQLLRGDGSLLTMPIVLTSPSNGQVLKYNGTFWVNSSDDDTGITTLNTLTALTQTFATGTTGTDFGIVSSGSTHTFNIPTASATNRGALSSADWTTFNNKQNALTNPVTGTGTTNYLPKWTSGSAIGNSLVYDSGTQIGIGTASPAAFLHIIGSESRFGGVASGFISIYNATGRSGYIQANGATDLRIASDTDPMTFYVGGSERMRLTSTGLGIGTTSPATKFVVSNAGASGLEIDPTGGVSSGVLLQAYNRSTSAYIAQSYYALSHTFNVGSGGGTRALDITSGGNVGIGTTSPTAKLHTLLNGNTSVGITGTTIIGQNSSSGNSSYLTLIGAFNASAGVVFTDESEAYKGRLVYDNNSEFMGLWTDGSERMRITSGGNVGIGNTSPSYPLEIASTNSLSIAYQRTGVSAKKWGFQSDNDSTYWYNITDNVLALTVRNTGNVGIGTTSPSEKLEVNGNIKATNLLSGTYTPTLTGVYNVASSTAYELQYMRVGNVVTVSGYIQASATAANTWTRISITLPISSTFDYSYRAGGGGGASATNNVCAIQAGAFGTSVVYLDSYPNTASTLGYTFSFTYLIM
jgi:hypothetical protein